MQHCYIYVFFLVHCKAVSHSVVSYFLKSSFNTYVDKLQSTLNKRHTVVNHRYVLVNLCEKQQGNLVSAITLIQF